jgi:HEAT repeat protein
MKPQSLLLAFIIVCLQLAVFGSVGSRLVHGNSWQLNVIETDTDIEQIMNKIYSSSIDDRAMAKNRIIMAAKQSAENRNIIVRRLIRLLEENAAPENSNPNTGAWYASAAALGELKATEAIEVLAQNLDYNNGVHGLSLAHYPAIKALIDIGNPAVPRLTQVLFEHEDPMMRECAARTLAHIGGKEVREILEQALNTEREAGVCAYIQKQLKGLKIKKESSISRKIR